MLLWRHMWAGKKFYQLPGDPYQDYNMLLNEGKENIFSAVIRVKTQRKLLSFSRSIRLILAIQTKGN